MVKSSSGSMLKKETKRIPRLQVNALPTPASRKLKGPLSVISVPQSSLASSDHAMGPMLLSDDDAEYDLMEIHLTIYSITGIIGRKDKSKQTQKSSFSISSKSKFTRSQASSSGAGCGLSNSLPTNISRESYEGPEDDGFPITAVVSCHRNAISSGTALETFLPSLPLVASTAVSAGVYRYQASWVQSKSTLATRDKMEDTESFTFKIIRAMKRESYRPGLNVEDISNYSNETIDIKVSLGHSTDLITLGVASIVVTGDEEGGVIMKAPVKAVAEQDTKGKSRSGGSTKKKRLKPSFSYNPEWQYSIEDNSTLRIGVRVVPVRTETSADENQNHKTPSACLKSSPPAAKNIVFEMDDEHKMMTRMYKQMGSLTETETETKDQHTGDAVKDGGNAVKGKGTSFHTSMLCLPVNMLYEEVMDLLPGGMTRQQIDSTMPHVLDSLRAGVEKVTKKTVAAVKVRPSSFFSSVSESTDEGSVDNARSFESLAESHFRSVQLMVEKNLQTMHNKLLDDGKAVRDDGKTIRDCRRLEV